MFAPYPSRAARALLAAACLAGAASARAGDQPPPARESAPPPGPFQKPSDEALRERLTPEQYRVTQHAGTEPPFRNAYWDDHRAGIYVDVVSGEPLFSSLDKFDSGTGWPSFTKPIAKENIVEIKDSSFGMERIAIACARCDAHQGHVFDDGPPPAGLRYCINSVSMRFVKFA